MFLCRWDVYRSNYLGNEAACLCPATETTCAKDRKCWWYEVGWSQMTNASWHLGKLVTEMFLLFSFRTIQTV